MSLRFVTALAVAVAAASSPALACKGPTLIFSDDFKTADPGWLQQYGKLTIGDGKLQLNSEPGKYASTTYQGFFVDSGDICVDMVSPAVKDPSTVTGGIMFGAVDYSNFYIFTVWQDGTAGVSRLQNGGWLSPVPFRPTPAVKTTPNAVNTLRVTFKGTTATTYVNDQLVTAFKIQPFTNGTFGLYAEPEGNTFQFSNIKVTNAP